MKNNIETKKIVLCAILVGVMFVLSWTPLGMVPLGIVSPTTIFIPVVIGVILIDDWRYSLALGTAFGIVSWIRAFVPSGILDVYFVNPIVSVFPRALMGIVLHYLYQLLKLIKVKIVRYSIAGAAGAILNTIFTITTLCTVYYKDITNVLLESQLSWGKWLFGTIALLNMLPEMLVGAVVATAICKVLDKLILSNINSINPQEDL